MTLCPLVSSDHGLHRIMQSFQACRLTQPSSASCSAQTPFSLLQDSSAQQRGALRLQSIGLLRQSQPPRRLPGARSCAHHHHPPQEGRPGHLPDLALRNQVPAFGQQVQSWPLTASVRGSQWHPATLSTRKSPLCFIFYFFRSRGLCMYIYCRIMIFYTIFKGYFPSTVITKYWL